MVQTLGNEREREKIAGFHCDRFLLKGKEVKMDKKSKTLLQASFPS
jgi:hypothetical protein